ncbi:C40 family peptidase [Dactylosporangium sp. NPDC005555]|uniref:C40 family peptidase n=1 Tax=Dactylosporangium sp. NPDC005555 TaxID=3154889 RepID=UPI0033BB1F34
MRQASVGVPVATLWSAPDRTRPSDTAASRDTPDIGAWIAAMTPDEQTGSSVVTQALLGEEVLVEQDHSDGWSRVLLPAQPSAGLDPRGYPGWIRTAHLTAPATDGTRLVIDAMSTTLARSPGGPVVVPGVVLGTVLTPAGPADRGWLPVHVAGHAEPLWAPEDDLALLPSRPPTGDEALAVARRLLGATYVWGGLSTLGVDCSGLVHLVWRRLGVTLPRDAHDQAAATTAVPPGDERLGDLFFFARPGSRVHHVGIVVTPAGATPARLLHAAPGAHRVVEEPMPAQRTETLAGTHRP